MDKKVKRRCAGWNLWGAGDYTEQYKQEFGQDAPLSDALKQAQNIKDTVMANNTNSKKR